MDYEKKYKEALERAKEFVSKDVVEAFRCVFPELKESEDERIRKTLVRYHKSTIDIDGIKGNDIVTWLEKQGKITEENMLLPFKEYDNLMESINKRKKEGYEAGYKQGLIDAKEEHKCGNDVEPKFKDGDWIVFNGLVLLIKEVVYGYYRTISINNTPHSYDWSIDKAARLWTITDARIGDVLVSEFEQPFIYNGMFDNFSVGGFCGIESTGVEFAVALDNHKTWTNNIGIHPATKEQCDTLLKAMTDAGYTFDFNKKELKKIEQKSIQDYNSIDPHFGKPIEQNPVWSEEDERFLNVAINILNSSKVYTKSPDKYEDAINWLKSLKERVQLQPNQEWKQENTDDLTEFENALMHIGGSFFGQHAGLNPNDTNAIKEQANLLLELVPKQEWNGEDERYLSYAIYAVEDMLGNNGKNTVTWLKSLRSQNHWKPSEEHLKNLKQVVNCDINGWDKNCLEDLYKRLKEL